MPEDTEEAIKWFQKSAEHGDASAQYFIGAMYYKGCCSTPKNLAEALKWLQKSAEKNNAHAQYLLGTMYRKGEGVAKDYATAVKWLYKADNLNNEMARHDLKTMFVIPEAMTWLQEAADNGDSIAQFVRGYLYIDARTGLPKDEKDEGEAMKWMHKSAENGNARAQFMLAELYNHHDDAGEWYRKAADNGDMRAQQQMAISYIYGYYNVKYSYVEAAKWATKSADQGYKPAMQLLQGLYYDGKGVPKDRSKSEELMKKIQDLDEDDDWVVLIIRIAK